MQELLEAVRKATLPAIWSQGVKLARASAVSSAAASDHELTLRVRASGHLIAPTVTLYLRELEWTCDCGGKVDPCAHVAAAAIASAQGLAGGPVAATGQPVSPARLRYAFGKKDRLLTLQRLLVREEGAPERFLGNLQVESARGRLPPGLSPTHEDLLVDRILGAAQRDVVPLGRTRDLFEALSKGADVTFLDQPARVSADAVTPRAVVEDGPSGGFVLRLEQDPAVSEIVAMGVVRVAGVLRPIADGAMTGHFLERLPLVRSFARAEETELVTRVLPELEKKYQLHVATRKLPRKKKHVAPRIALDLSHQGHTLSVLPLLVYGDPPIARVDGSSVTAFGKDVPIRDVDAERRLLKDLRGSLNLVPGRRVDLDGQEALRFASRLRAWQRQSGPATQQAAAFDAQPLSARIEWNDGQFDVVFERESESATEGTARAEAATVMRAWRDGLDLVPLSDGGWAPLPLNWLEQHGQRVADLLAARDAEKKLAKSALPELGALCRDLDAPVPVGLDKLAPLLGDFQGIPHAELPAGVQVELRHYQQQGVDWLTFLRQAELGAVLADDMGLGKTVQTICALRGRVLVVCPKSVVYNWADEIARFRPGLRTVIYHGVRRELDPAADVTLTTYAILRMDAKLLSEQAWDVVVLDEAQAIKNASSQTARAAFELNGKFKVALSGTPVENRLEELWSVMHFANPGLLGGRSDFQDRYAGPIGVGNAEAAVRLRTKVRPFVLRRMKREVLPELPARTDMVLHVELEETERAVYDAVRVATRQDIAEKLQRGGGVLAALEALLRLRQASCHPALVPGQDAETSSKIERLLEALEDAAADGHKALVFSQWTSLLDLVEPHLNAAGIGFTRLDGTTRDRAAVVQDFQRPAGPPVMLVSLKAGGTGLNLTAADHVFLLDPWWNPAVEDQAADRAHRIGQDRPVMVYRLVARDTVEERILALQERKRALFDAALGDAAGAVAITREELLALLE
ncbi:MAG TPA: DEAD/DEAH box helicase [Polyangiaceae bacterium]